MIQTFPLISGQQTSDQTTPTQYNKLDAKSLILRLQVTAVASGTLNSIAVYTTMPSSGADFKLYEFLALGIGAAPDQKVFIISPEVLDAANWSGKIAGIIPALFKVKVVLSGGADITYTLEGELL